MKLNNQIWLLSDDFPSKGFPTFVFVEQLVLAIVDHGVKVSVIAPQSVTKAIIRGRGILPRYSVEKTKHGNEFYVYRPYVFSFGNHFQCLRGLLSNVKKRSINRVLEKHFKDGDVLYGHFWSSGYGLLPYAVLHHSPLFVACGEGDNAMEEMAEKMSCDKKKILCDYVTGVIAVSTENKRKCINLGFGKEERVTVLPNCVDESLFYPKINQELKNRLNISHEDFTVAFVGAFINRKGSKVLSDAIDLINDKHLKSIFIGAPLDSEDCSPSCNGIAYKGKVAHDDIPEYLACADVFVLPTQNEGCSNAIVEALACGMPVISSNRPFNADILNENNAILINPDSAEDVANAIKKLMYDEDLYKKYKTYAVKHAGDFSIKDRASKILGFIQSKTNKDE